MLTPILEIMIKELPGREIKGRMNEMLILILLLKNHEAAEKSKNIKITGFRGRRNRQKIIEGITTSVLSKEMKTSQSTVATTIKRLGINDYVTHSKGEPVFITKVGIEKAKELLRHHRLIEVLLVNSLGISAETAHNQATKYMLLIDCEMVNTIAARYENPKLCPDGEEIPESTLCNNDTLV